jgi:hypothetical protein
MILPLFVGREMSIKAMSIHSAATGLRSSSRKRPRYRKSDSRDLFSVGTITLVMRMLKLLTEGEDIGAGTGRPEP